MPHIMKKNILLLAFVAFALVACDLNTVISPGVQVSSSLYRTYTTQDSLGRDTIVKDTITFTDSLNIGDTVLIPMVCQGYYDYLRMVKVSPEDTSKMQLSLAWEEEYKSVLAEDADPAHGYLSFLPEKVFAFYTTIKLVPVASGTHRVDIQALSNAKENYSQGSWHFFVAVK